MAFDRSTADWPRRMRSPRSGRVYEIVGPSLFDRLHMRYQDVATLHSSAPYTISIGKEWALEGFVDVGWPDELAVPEGL